MNINQNKHNVAKYLPTSDIEPIWEMCVSSIGIQTIGPQETYPAKGHLAKYTFNPERGRIIDEYALVYITKGEGLFSSLTCSCKKITKGDLFFLLPEQWHTYHPSAETGWDEYYVTFHGNYFKKLIPYIINLSYPIFHIGINEQIIKHFGEMLDCATAQRTGFQALLTGTLMHIIGIVYSINKNQDYGNASMQKIQEACIRMRENIYDKFTPEEIAQSLNMSYSNFRKSFKQCTGVAPHQYLLQLKLSKTKDLLSNTDMSIQEIAMKLNFESADYFSYFFRSKTGINPLSYRKEIKRQRDKAQKTHFNKS